MRPVTGASIALMISEKLSLLPALFEVTSAFGTVGLSLNVTLDLSALGKILISMVMFLGRVGTLTLIVASPSGRNADATPIRRRVYR